MCIIDPMYIETVPNRNSPPAILLREGWREGNKTLKRTLANLSDWPPEKIQTFRRLLHDEPLVSPHDLLSTQKTLPHGHVEAILLAIHKLGLDSMISAQRCRERDLVLAMIVERLLYPCSKLATTRHWHSTSLAEELGVSQATEDQLYEAMDWLLERQPRIEKKLAARHLQEGSLVLYDVSSSYYEGRTCPLAQYGHDRDGKKGLPIIVYGLMTDGEGAVGQSLLCGEQIVGRDQGLVVQQATEGLDFLWGPIGEVGQSALKGFVAFAPALAEEDGGRGVAVGDGLDVHGSYYAHINKAVKENNVNYMGTFPQCKIYPSLKQIKNLTQNLG